MGISIQKYPDMQERFIENSYKINPNIKDYEDFIEALNRYLGDTAQGEKAKQILDDDDYRELFESRANRKKIKENISDDEYDEIFERTDDKVKGVAEIEIIKKPKRDRTILEAYKIPKKIEVKSYTKAGKTIKPYIKSYRQWSPKEENYIKGLKQEKVPSGQIIKQYRERFSGIQRSSSSIKTKLFRV